MYDTKTPVDSVWYKKPDYTNKNPYINVGTYNMVQKLITVFDMIHKTD